MGYPACWRPADARWCRHCDETPAAPGLPIRRSWKSCPVPPTAASSAGTVRRRYPRRPPRRRKNRRRTCGPRRSGGRAYAAQGATRNCDTTAERPPSDVGPRPAAPPACRPAPGDRPRTMSDDRRHTPTHRTPVLVYSAAAACPAPVLRSPEHQPRRGKDHAQEGAPCS